MGMTDVGGIPVVQTSAGGYGDCGMGGGNFIWAFLLFALLGNRGGFGGYGGNGGAVAAVDNTVWEAQNFQRLENGQQGLNASLQRIGDGICSSVYALNNSIKDGNFALAMGQQNGFNAIGNAICATSYEQARQIDGLSRQMAECCCDLRSGQAAIVNTIERTAAAAELREAYAKIAEQNSALSEQRIISTVLQNLQPPRPIPAYQVCNPYTGATPCF